MAEASFADVTSFAAAQSTPSELIKTDWLQNITNSLISS
jgi:hypothetical protein